MLLAILSIWCNFHVNAIVDTGASTSFSNKGFGQKARDQTKKTPSFGVILVRIFPHSD